MKIGKKLANNTVIVMTNILKQAIEEATILEITNKNSCKKIKMPLQEETKVCTFEKSEQDKIEKYCLSSKKSNYIGIVVCLYTGLRIGEILALKWRDVDFESKVIKIRSSLTAKLNFNNNGQIIKRISVLGSTKTECSLRNVPMPNKLLECLLDWHNEISFLSKINNKPKQTYILGGVEPRTYTSISKMFHRFLKQNDFDKFNIRFHTLRHTYATMLLEKGTNPKIVQFLLGHRSVKTTLEIYNSIVGDSFEIKHIVKLLFD